MAVSSPTMADKDGERESIFFVMIEGVLLDALYMRVCVWHVQLC